MGVDELTAEGLHRCRAKDAHETRADHQIRLSFSDSIIQGSIPIQSIGILVRIHDEGGNTCRFGSSKSLHVRAISSDRHDLWLHRAIDECLEEAART